jgi:hypothetical protein
MKHLRRFNESDNSQYIELRDSMQEFTDAFGDPEVLKYGKCNRYKWTIGDANSRWLDKDGLEKMIDAYNNIKDNALTLADRLADTYKVLFNMTATEFMIELKENDDYEFIKGVEEDIYDFNILISRSEVERWASDNGIQFAGFEENPQEEYSTTDLILKFSGPGVEEKLWDFESMLDAEKVGFDQPGKELGDMFFIQVGEGSDEVYLGVNDDEYEDTHIKLV